MVKVIFIFVFIALANAEYHHKYEPAPLGPHGEVVDTPEVLHQKLILEKAQREAIDKLHKADEYKHEYKYDEKEHEYKYDEKEHHLRTEHDKHDNFYNIYGKYDLVDGKYIPKTKEVYIAADEHLKTVHEIKEKLYH